MTDAKHSADEAEQSPEDRAMYAEMAYDLLARAMHTLVQAYGRARPGDDPEANRRFIQALHVGVGSCVQDRAVHAETAYDLLAREMHRLAQTYEEARPGEYPEVNRRLMKGVVADLIAVCDELPEGVLAPKGQYPAAAGVVAGRLRATLFDIEVRVGTGTAGRH